MEKGKEKEPSLCSRISSDRQMKTVCPKIENVETLSWSKRNGLNAVTVPKILLRGSRGMRNVCLEELKYPERS